MTKKIDQLYAAEKTWILANYKKAKSNLQAFYKSMDKWSDQYRSKTKKDKSTFYNFFPRQTTIADVFVPETFKGVQTIKSRLMSYTTEEDRFEIEEHVDCPPEVRDAYTQFLKNQYRESRHEIEMEKFYLTLLKYGTGIVKKYWQTETIVKNMPVLIPLLDKGTGEVVIDPKTSEPMVDRVETQKVKIQKGSPYTKNVNLKNISLIGDTDNFYELDGVIEEVENVDWNYLWQRRKRTIKLKSGEEKEIGVYFNLDLALQMNIKPGGEEDDDDKNPERNPSEISSDKKSTKKVKHTLLEAWVYRDLNKDGHKESVVITLLDKKLIIGVRENPFDHKRMPYFLSPCLTQEDNIYGIGLCELSESLQWELNTKRNQLLDTITFTLDHMWIKVDRSIVNSELKKRPGGIINTNRIDGVKALKPETMDVNAGIASVRMLQEDISQVMGAVKPLQGEKMKGRVTAGEQRSVIRESSYRIVDIMKNVERHILYPDLQMTHELNQQFVEEMIVQQKGQHEVKLASGEKKMVQNLPIVLKKKDIRFDFKFVFHVATQVENREIKNQLLLNYIETMKNSGLPPVVLGIPIYKLMKQIWINMGLGEVETVFPRELEAQIFAMFQQQGIEEQGNPENTEQKLEGQSTGKLNA